MKTQNEIGRDAPLTKVEKVALALLTLAPLLVVAALASLVAER